MVDLYMPSSIPDVENQSIQYVPLAPGVRRSQFDGGQKSRPTRSSELEQLACTLYLEPAQLKTLLDFYLITCRRTQPFYWWDWRWPTLTERYATYEFLARPSYDKWEDMWRVNLQLLVRASFEGNFLLDFYDNTHWPTT